MIKLYAIQIDHLPERRELREHLLVPYYEVWRRRHRNIREERVARASMGGLFLLQLAGLIGNLIYGEKGRPSFTDLPIDFNISHNDEYVFCAVEYPDDEAAEESILYDASGRPYPFPGECRIGLDAEEFTRITHLRICPLAQRWFAPAEFNRFLLKPTDETFLSLWTHKESLVKWLGDGLLAMRDTDTTVADTAFGVTFREYRLDHSLIVLCHRVGTKAPDEIQMFTRDDFDGVTVADR